MAAALAGRSHSRMYCSPWGTRNEKPEGQAQTGDSPRPPPAIPPDLDTELGFLISRIEAVCYGNDADTVEVKFRHEGQHPDGYR